MDPTTVLGPTRHGPARGQAGGGTLGIHAPQAQRCICHECQKTCSATTGTAFYRLRTAAETVRLVVTWRTPGCPGQASGAALGFAERTVAAGGARSGRQGQAGQAFLVERPRDLGQVQADARRVKQQGGLVWLGGEGSAPRDLALLRRRSERVRRCAAHRPLWCWTEGVGASSRAMRAPWRDPGHTATGGRPRRRPWRQGGIAPGGKRDERRRVGATESRLVDGPPAWRRSDAARKGTGGAIQRPWSGATPRCGTAAPRWRAGAGRWPASPGGWSTGCTCSGQSITVARSTRVSALLPRRLARERSTGHLPWQLGSPTMAGRSEHCWRFRCRRHAGHHRSSAGVLHGHCNV
jgi:hypothetical protein